MWRLASDRTHFPSLACWGLGAVLLAGSALVSAADQSAGERYAKILADSASLARYNQQLTTQLESQQAQIALIEKQLVEIDTTAAEVPPLIQKMFESLEKFLASDLPFLDPTQAGPDSRQERIARIRDLMASTSDADESAAPVAAGNADPNAPKEGEGAAAVDATVSAADAEKERALQAEKEHALNAERYRRLLEAYQIELDYGRTMVSYKGKLEDGRDADFVRVGRVSLLYRTTDGEEAGYWDAQQKKWVADNDYNKAIENAVLIASKESAPDLVTVPVPAPQEVPL
jgi:hypothetical protein